MNREDYVQRLAHLHLECLDIIKRKVDDYAAGDDPFRNFRTAPLWGVSVAHGILVRMGDKMSRVASLLEKDEDPAVTDEGVADTLKDLANYALILAVWLECQSPFVRGRDLALNKD